MTTGFQGDQQSVAAFEGALAAILDYSGALDNLIGTSGMGISAFLSSYISVALTNMIGARIIKNHPGSNKVDLIRPFHPALYSAILAIIFNALLGSRIQNPKILSASATFIGTYAKEMNYDPTS